MVVTGQGDLSAELLGVELFALAEGEGIGGEEGGGREAVDGGRGRHQQHLAFPLAHGPEGGQALGDQILVRRETVVGQGFPVRQQPHLDAGREPGDFFQQALGVQGIGGNDGKQASSGFLGGLGQQQGIEGARAGRPVHPVSGLRQGRQGQGRKTGGRGHGRAAERERA